eukprot:TRINITY_DN4508_c0_g1_i1.p1 TRINITY_DN4508_c0_g1~~TRINITY_DN4508_c0_g1_i1.p1  ORF type:complete len:624 (-),score=168.24 TRINITY_DN4508_c0_g1_i1:172-2043(-)
MVKEPEPITRLCTVLKTIGNSSDMDKEDATDVALGLAKLMKSQDESSLICFLCKRKCSNRSKFLLHFRSHFSRHRKRIPDSEESAGGTEEDEFEGSISSAMQQSPIRMKKKKKRKKSIISAEALKTSEAEGSSSECLGDSESSDSDMDPHKGFKDDSSSAGSVSLKDRLSLAEKQLDNNETEDLVCLTCLKRFSNCQNLRRHLRLHISRDSITPDIENDSSSSGRYFCDWCPARFDNRSAARVHEETHKNDQTKCYICDKLYADRYSLRYHLRTHGIGRQIRCEYCNKSFSKPSRLDSHVKSHHNNIRDFKCSVCEKAFKTRLHLTNHFRQHSGEKPFACEICNVRFRHKASLLAHVRSHEGLRPYCCEICGKTFKEPSTLKAHSRVHTGDKPYKCKLCDKTFTQRAGLNYHKRLHNAATNETLLGGLLSCQLCQYSTYCQSTLNTHYRNSHSGPSQETHHQETQPNKLPSFDHLRSGSASPSSSPSMNSNEAYLNEGAQLLTTRAPSASPCSSSQSSDSSSMVDHTLLPDYNNMQMDMLNGYGQYGQAYGSSDATANECHYTMNYHQQQPPQQQGALYGNYQSYYDQSANPYKYYSDTYSGDNVYYSSQQHMAANSAAVGYC